MSAVVDSSDVSEKAGEEDEKIIIFELPLVGRSCLPYEHRDIP